MGMVHYEKKKEVFVFQIDIFFLQPQDNPINQNGLCYQTKVHPFWELDNEQWLWASKRPPPPHTPNSEDLKDRK